MQTNLDMQPHPASDGLASHGMNGSMRDYLRIVFRQKAVILTTVVTVVITAHFGLQLRKPTYESQVKMLISAEKLVQAPNYRELMGKRDTEAALTQTEIVKSTPVLERAVRILKLDQRPAGFDRQYASNWEVKIDDLRKRMLQIVEINERPSQRPPSQAQKALEALKKRMEVEPVRGTNLLSIRVKASEPMEAVLTANVISRSYIIYDLEQQLADLALKYGEKHPQVQQLKANIATLSKSLNGRPLSNIEAIGPATVKVIEQASTPVMPKGMPRALVMLLSLIVGGMMGLAFGFISEQMDPTFRSMPEIRQEIPLPLLGTIPRRHWAAGALRGTGGTRRYDKFYQSLADQVYLLVRAHKLQTIMVTAMGTAQKTSVILANLGLRLSQKAGRKVLLIDANFRCPTLHRVFKIDNREGFANLLEDKASLDAVTRPIGERLKVITAGKTEANPVNLFDEGNTRKVLDESKKQHEIILIDCPTLNGQKDACVLAGFTDTTVLVISEGKDRRHVVKTALHPLVESGADILGLIVNNRDFPIPAVMYEWV